MEPIAKPIAKRGPAIRLLIARTDGRTNGRYQDLNNHPHVPDTPTPVESRRRLLHWLREVADTAAGRGDWGEVMRIHGLVKRAHG